MDYEKLHKDTIAKLQEMVNSGKITVETARGICADFVPESEDDRIKRDIIEVLRYGLECEESVLMPGATTTLKEATVWLEKQGEKGTNGNEREIPNSQQKSKIKYVYTKFREGDVIVEIKPNGDCDPVRVKYVGSSYYSCESDDGKVYLSLPIINQDEYKLIEQNPAWSEEDENRFINLCSIINESVKWGEASKQGFIRFLKSLKDMVQPKQEWSKEDDQYLLVCKNALAKYQTTDKWDAHIISHWLEDKLKSIRSQNTWKPSDDQIKGIRLARAFVVDDFDEHPALSETLLELEEQLRKLREE